MGALNDFIANQVVYDNSDQATAVERSMKRYFDELVVLQGDPAYPAGYAVANEVQSMATGSGSAGTFTVTVALRNGETFTTGNIAWDAIASAIETAVDTAASGQITGWTAGDISVSGGPPASAPVVFTYDGTSVAGQKVILMTTDDTLLTGASGAVTVTADGQTNRSAWAVMGFMNMVAPATAPPVQGLATPITVVGERGNMHLQPNADVLQAIALQAAIEDSATGAEESAIQTGILDGLRANGVSV